MISHVATGVCRLGMVSRRGIIAHHLLFMFYIIFAASAIIITEGLLGVKMSYQRH